MRFLLLPLFLIKIFAVTILPLPSPLKRPAAPLPKSNQQLLVYVVQKGKRLAPTYESAVCTEFLIKAIDPITHLTREERNQIRIISTKSVSTLLETEDPAVKGVQTALSYSGKGVAITNPDSVLPGDLVQFWENYWGTYYWGHCGIVHSAIPRQKLVLYSSHPRTDGFGIHEFSWPRWVYFVRLK